MGSHRVTVAPFSWSAHEVAENNLVQALTYKPLDAEDARKVAWNLAQIEHYLAAEPAGVA